jgi:tetratricopeptide (TPR) repeat protein
VAPTAERRAERFTIAGVRREHPEVLLSGAKVAFVTSRDPVKAPIFFRQVPLPFDFANHHTEQIRYSLGTVEEDRPPRVLLEGLPVCGNCHSFDRDGRTLGMDVDYANDKGSYVVTPLEPVTHLTPERIITWSDYKRGDGQLTFGLLSQLSPDARYVMSTVKDRSIFVGLPERLEYSQLFFPIRGILAFYDREHREYHSLPGANDPSFVQSNPNWTPDGKQLLFARTNAYHSDKVDASEGVILPVAAASEFLKGERGFQYDVYRIPFNDGKGGQPSPFLGASSNGMSNYFPRVSPDGKWMVFTESKNFMLLQPDSRLFIVPAAGGVARAMRCNTAKMNSWHSWSPNSRWLVFSSKLRGPYTQLWLTHVDELGNDAPPVLLEHLMSQERAANIPEFIAATAGSLQRIVDDFSDGGNYHYRVAKTLIHYNDLEEAVKRLDRALLVQPRDPDVWLERGAVLFSLGKKEKSFDDFRTAMVLAPDDYRGPYNLGVAQLASNQGQAAVDSLSTAIRLNARLPEILYQRATANLLLENVAAALADIRGAIALDPTSKKFRKFEMDLERQDGGRSLGADPVERTAADDDARSE